MRYLKFIGIPIFFIATIANVLNSQTLILGGQLGYGSPQGDVFSFDGERLSNFGVSVDLDAIYYLEKFEGKFGFGINYNTSLIFGRKTDLDFNFDLHGLSLYAVKVNYQFFDNKITPYVSLSTGLAQLSTPTIKDGNNNVLRKGDNGYSFGLLPQIGLDLNGFVLSFGYLVPMRYSLFNKKAGILQFSLGYRYNSLL